MQTLTTVYSNILTEVNLFLLDVLQHMAGWFRYWEEFGAIFFWPLLEKCSLTCAHSWYGGQAEPTLLFLSWISSGRPCVWWSVCITVPLNLLCCKCVDTHTHTHMYMNLLILYSGLNEHFDNIVIVLWLAQRCCGGPLNFFNYDYYKFSKNKPNYLSPFFSIFFPV